MTVQRTVHTLRSDALSGRQVAQIRDLLFAAFAGDEHGGFSEDDWQHALGGTHFVAEEDGDIVAHASVVERELHVAGRALRTGYVEAVATRPDRQRRGHGTALMRQVNALIERDFELGALGTGSQPFYERLGWRVWPGQSAVRTEHGERRTPHEDGYIMVLLTRSSPALDVRAVISCEWRPGDVW